jgi:hypothetical protein
VVQAVTKILDHGTANPIVARLTVQIFAILEHCEIAPETRDGIKVMSWGADHLRMPQFSQIYFVPESERDATQPVKYVVNATQELVEKIAKLETERQRGGG